MALVWILMNLLNYGFNLATVREIAKKRHNKEAINTIFSEVISVKLFLLVLISLFLFILVTSIPVFYNQKTLNFSPNQFQISIRHLKKPKCQLPYPLLRLLLLCFEHLFQRLLKTV